MKIREVKKKIFLNKSKNISIPVLIICYNRPLFLKKLLRLLEKYNVKNLYISQDGMPSANENDIKNHIEVRNIINSINWTKKIKKNFFSYNLGKQFAPPKSITWFFKQVKTGIILEDDTLPSKTFFYFAKYLLNFHKNDKNIFQISAGGVIDNRCAPYTYYSSMIFIHGWATWRDRWVNYSYKINDLKNFSISKNFRSIVPKFMGRLYWMSIFENFNKKKHITWDYPLVYYSMKNAKDNIHINKNMITNIGFKKDHVLQNRNRYEFNNFFHLKNVSENFNCEKEKEGWFFYNLSFRYKASLVVKFLFKKLITMFKG